MSQRISLSVCARLSVVIVSARVCVRASGS